MLSTHNQAQRHAHQSNIKEGCYPFIWGTVISTLNWPLTMIDEQQVKQTTQQIVRVCQTDCLTRWLSIIVRKQLLDVEVSLPKSMALTQHTLH